MRSSLRLCKRRPNAKSWPWLVVAACLVVWSCGTGDLGSADVEPAVVQESESGGTLLSLSLDRNVLTTSENLRLRLVVESAESDVVEFPSSERGFGDFAVTSDEPLRESLMDDGRVVRGREYVVQPFLPGEFELPALGIVVNGSSRITTDPVTITVESVLADPAEAELRDIAEPVDVPIPWWWWVVATAAFVALLATAAWWLKRRRAARSAPIVVLPHEAAIAALDALLAEGLPESGEIKSFYLRLSDIVRRYVEERFGLRAPEQTTEEFLAAMAAAPVIGNDHQRLLRGFLEQADMVKFAKFAPGKEQVSASVEAARRFVRQTVPDELIPAAGKGG